MKQDIVILGAGGSAGAIVDVINAINGVSRKWRLRGFLDDTPEKQGTTLFGAPLLGLIESAASMDDVIFVIGVASHRTPFGRADIATRLGFSAQRFATLIHPLACVSPTATVGSGVLMFPFVVVSDNATVGNHAYLSSFCFVGHHATVGAAATMAPRASLHGGSHLGASAYAGSHSALREGMTVGEGAVVGMGSIVLHDVPARTTVTGNPARPIIGKLVHHE